MRARLHPVRRHVLTASALVGMLVAGLAPATPAPAATTCTAEQKPRIFQVEDMFPGTTGTGWTVIEGRDPEPFDVEILGVLPDGIYPGIDFVLIKASGPMIDRTGGIAFGMSGSPIYVGDELAGAVAFGFFAADQTIGGMMPAEAMVPILDYPPGTAGLRAAQALQVEAVELTPALRRTAAREAGMAVEDFPTLAKQLSVPLAVSGLNDRAMKKVNRLVKRLGLPVVPYRANGVSGGESPAEEPMQPGGAVAATLSVGDLTLAGVGTTTVVCGDRSLHFGHPFFFDGATSGSRSMGMNAAEVLTVVPDPSQIFGPFKVANIAEPRGAIDQDRLAGIRGAEGRSPASVLVETEVLNTDLGRIRHGQTEVIKQDIRSFSLLPFLAAFHLLANEDVVFDRIGDGSSMVSFTINGAAPDGTPFSLTRDNMWFSEWDIAWESIIELLYFMEILDAFDRKVGFSGVSADVTLTENRLTAEIEQVLTASSLRPRLRERSTLPVRRGDTVTVRVMLRPHGSDTLEAVDLALRVPKAARRNGYLQVRGGGDYDCFFCILFEEEFSDGEEEAESFEELLARLQGAERNSDLIASLRVRGRERSALSSRDLVVLGERFIRLRVRR